MSSEAPKEEAIVSDKAANTEKEAVPASPPKAGIPLSQSMATTASDSSPVSIDRTLARTTNRSLNKEMAGTPSHHSVASENDAAATDGVQAIDLPRGWKYKQFSIGGYKLPWYASPSVQLGMVAFVCFMCPGMFNALGGLGGGGKVDPTLVDNMVRSLVLFDCSLV